MLKLLAISVAGLVSFTRASLVVDSSDKVAPIAIFHGMGDECDFWGMSDFVQTIANGTGAYAECIEVGAGSMTSLF